jgi:hypothetical protein
MLPTWIEPEYFQRFIDILELDRQGKLTTILDMLYADDLEIAQKLIWLVDFF